MREAREDFPAVTIRLPGWVGEYIDNLGPAFESLEQKMNLAIALGDLNHRWGTGGPFGAAIFEETGRLVAVGVNLVVSGSCSFAHAEMVAIGIAQQKLGTYDLGSSGLPSHQLVTSTEPCAMCLGATIWSGVRQLVCGARDVDARAIGFDEGPKISDWTAALAERGIGVVQDVCRQEARALLERYAEAGGRIYNARQA